MDNEKVTEYLIQNKLYEYLRFQRSFRAIFPNMATITMYEADILALTGSGYVYEYEIKTSLSDFRADLKKRLKHASLSGNVRRIKHPWWEEEEDIWVCDDAPTDPHKAIMYRCYPQYRPKQFWYVIHGFELPTNELPPYAGLMRYHAAGHFETLVEAPTLKAQKARPETIDRALSNMLCRYWNIRMKELTMEESKG